jgi:hypothetical protein
MRFNKSSPMPGFLADGLTIRNQRCVQKVLQQQSNKSGFASTWMDNFSGLLRAQIASGASLPFICSHIATMPAEYSRRFSTKIPTKDSVKVKVTLTRSAFEGGTTWKLE